MFLCRSYPTETIVSKNARKHYRIPVRSQYVARCPYSRVVTDQIPRHWQLRSLISAEKRHIVYFPGGQGSNQVQRLNIATNECETIKLLTFAPRCLVAENGWLCCGSENGEFVAIRLEEDTASSTAGTTPTYDPNARLPQNIERHQEDSLLSLLSIPTAPRRSNKSLIAKSMKLAKDRVNCITLWFPPTYTPPCEEAYTEPVAVLANNDRTVTLISLIDFEHYEKTEPLEVIPYPDYVNRATISPDGQLLIAILDDPFLYVHKRVAKSSSWGDDPEHKWEQAQRILLKSQKKDDKSDSRGSFAACFSSTGAYLAVGTQHGTISIFDTALLTDPNADPLITTFQSSRPQSSPGAVRDMEFCPGPYDILAWTEDRGRIGVADVRTNFKVRQVIDINAEQDFEHINILDRNTIDPRLLDGQRHHRAEGVTVNIPGDGNRDTPSRPETRPEGDNLDFDNPPLDSTETTVLEAIRGDRRRARERAAQRGGILQRNAEDILRRGSSDASSTPRRTPLDVQRSRQQQENLTTRSIVSDLLGDREQRAERDRERYRYYRANIRDNPERQQATRRPAQQRLMDSINETVEAMRDSRDRPDSSYLSVLEILQGREGSMGEDESSLLAPLVNQVVSRWEESAIRGTLAPDHGVFEVPPSPDNTAGLAWSEDGRTL